MHDLNGQIGVYLDHVVQRIDADDILKGPVVGSSQVRPSDKPTGRMPVWVYAAVAAAVVLLFVGVAGYLQSRQVEQVGFPPDTLVGLHDLPPEGAKPSTPPTGELVASMWSHNEADEWFATGSIYVYADGRLIWNSFLPGDPLNTTGWLEQRLTPEGVALVHDEIIATGLFDPDVSVPPKVPPALGHIVVRVGDQLVVKWNRSVTDEFDQIHERLRKLHSWLPASAWEGPEPRMFVPSTYGLCLGYDAILASQPAEPSTLLALLPAPAQQLLMTTEHYRDGELGDKDPAAGEYFRPQEAPHCYEVTTEQARSLVDMLNQAGFGRNESDVRLAFEATDPESRRVYITLVPFMPHGVPAT